MQHLYEVKRKSPKKLPNKRLSVNWPQGQHRYSTFNNIHKADH